MRELREGVCGSDGGNGRVAQGRRLGEDLCQVAVHVGLLIGVDGNMSGSAAAVTYSPASAPSAAARSLSSFHD